MRIEHYNQSRHASIHRWLKRHNHPPVLFIPEFYWVVPGVAALGLVTVGHRSLLMDSLVTNPLVSSETRHKAISALTAFLLGVADAANKSVLTFTSSDTTLLRAKSAGFVQLPDTLLIRTPKDK